MASPSGTGGTAEPRQQGRQPAQDHPVVSPADTPDPGSFGGHPYTPDGRKLGYGTDHDPRDPVVSPADTREAACPGCGRPVSECQAEDVDESPSLADMPGKDEIEAFIASSQWCNEVPDVPDTPVATWGTLAWARLALALLAVGERDENEIHGLRCQVETLSGLLDGAEAERERDRQQIARLTADFNELRLWTAQHLGAIDLEDVDGDVAQVLSSLDSIVIGNAGCTEEEDYTPEQWRVLQLCAVLAGEEDARG